MSESVEPSLDDVLSVLDAWDLIVVSNRQPYRHTFDEDDEIVVDRPAGGLTAGHDPVVQETDGTWVAWGDGDADRIATDDNSSVRVPPEDPAYTLKRVWLSESDVADYYYGFSNRVLWPLCHSLETESPSRIATGSGTARSIRNSPTASSTRSTPTAMS